MKVKLILIFLFTIFCAENTFAARSHTIANLNGSPVNFYMRDSVTMNLRVTNTNTGGDVNLSINRVRLTFPASTLTVNNTGHIPPTGWTVTVNSATQITFDSTNPIYNITTNNFRDFLVSLTVVAGATDSNQEYLQSSVVRYNVKKNNTHTLNSPSTVSWFRRGLKITSMVASPDILTSGDPFTLTITVQNVSSTTQTNITANPNPPSEISTGGFNPSTNSNPSIGSLAVLATGTLIYNYTTNNNDEGTVYFTCNVRNGLNNTTGISTNSNVVFIGRFTANIVYSPLCPLSGETINVTMTVTNNYTFSLSNVTPTLNVYGTATLIKLSGPTPATIATLNANGGTGTFTYTYTISGNYDDTFYFVGNATGNKTTPPVGLRTSTTYTTPTKYIRDYSLSISPNLLWDKTKNSILNISIVNQANNSCSDDTNYYVNKFTINLPSGFNYISGRSSYLIGNNIFDEDNPDCQYYTSGWNVSENISSISFASSSVGYNLISNKDAIFSLFFLDLPKVSNNSTFNFNFQIENVKGVSINKTLQFTVSPTPIGSTKKPSLTKGGHREKHE